MSARIYKVIKQANGKASYLYFTDPALPNVATKLFANAGANVENIGIAAFDQDTKAVDLTSFLDGGGILSGPTEIK